MHFIKTKCKQRNVNHIAKYDTKPDCIRCASRRRSPAGRANDISTPHIIWRGKTNLFPRRRSCGVKNFDIIVSYKLIHDSLRGICNLGNF